MFLMSKFSIPLSFLFILFTMTGCFSPSLPKHNIVSYTYENLTNDNFQVSGKIEREAHHDDKKLFIYKASISTLHRYLQKQNRDIYSEKELSASTDFVKITNIQKESDGSYSYDGVIEKEAQKELSNVNIDLTYYQLFNNKQNQDLFKNRYWMYDRFHTVCAYYAALEYVPHTPVVDTIYSKYILSLKSIKSNTLGSKKKIESEYSSSFSQKKLYQINKSFRLDMIKARFLANVSNHIPNSLNRIYNSSYTTFFNLKSQKVRKFMNFSLDDKGSIYTKESYIDTKEKTMYNIEIEYILEVPRTIDTSKVYLTPSLSSKLFDVYFNGVKVETSSNFYTVEPFKNSYNDRVIEVKIKSKKPINSQKFTHFFQALKERPILVGAYKRGGLSSVEVANSYVYKKEREGE